MAATSAAQRLELDAGDFALLVAVGRDWRWGPENEDLSALGRSLLERGLIDAEWWGDRRRWRVRCSRLGCHAIAQTLAGEAA